MKNLFYYIIEHWFPKIAEINRKYSRPRVALTPAIRFSLLALRIYLLFLVLLLVYKFLTLL